MNINQLIKDIVNIILLTCLFGLGLFIIAVILYILPWLALLFFLVMISVLILYE